MQGPLLRGPGAQVAEVESLQGCEAAPDVQELSGCRLPERDALPQRRKPKLLQAAGVALAVVLLLLAAAAAAAATRGSQPGEGKAAEVLQAAAAAAEEPERPPPLEDWRDPLDPEGRPGRLPGEHRTVTMAGFYRSELNGRYTERFGKEYVVNGRETYWGRGEKLFLYDCNYTGRWIISTADMLEGIRDERRCDYTAKGPKGKDILDYNKPLGWSEWLDGDLKPSPRAGVHILSTAEWLAQDNRQHDTMDIYPSCKRPPYSSIEYLNVYSGQVSKRDELVSNVQLDQGSCNACWAITIASVVERLLCIQGEGQFHGLAASLSAAYITSCASPAIVGEDGCDVGGGRALEALRWVGKNGVPTGGAPTHYWTCVPFFEVNRTAPTRAPPCPESCTSREYMRTLQEDLFVPAGLEYSYETTAIESAKDALEHGPILILIPVYEDFQNYTGGIYEHKAGKYLGPHFMIAHGYTDEYFQGFNSWGVEWGFQGSYRVRLGFPRSFVIPGRIGGTGAGYPYPLPDVRHALVVTGFADERLNGAYEVWIHSLSTINGQPSAWKGDDSIIYRCGEKEGFWAIATGLAKELDRVDARSTEMKDRQEKFVMLRQQLEEECRWNAHAPPRPAKVLLQCESWVLVKGAEKVQPVAMGNFTMVEEQGRYGRPVYQNEHGQYLFFFPEYHNWRIGPDPGSDLARVMEVPAKHSMCPSQAEGWEVFNHGWSDAFEIEVVPQRGAGTDWVELVNGKEVLRPNAGITGFLPPVV